MLGITDDWRYPSIFYNPGNIRTFKKDMQFKLFVAYFWKFEAMVPTLLPAPVREALKPVKH